MVVQKQIQTPLHSHRVTREARDKLHPLCCCCQGGEGQQWSPNRAPWSRRGRWWLVGHPPSAVPLPHNIPVPAGDAGGTSGPLARRFLLSAQTCPCPCAGGNAMATGVTWAQGHWWEQPGVVGGQQGHQPIPHPRAGRLSLCQTPAQ